MEFFESIVRYDGIEDFFMNVVFVVFSIQYNNFIFWLYQMRFRSCMFFFFFSGFDNFFWNFVFFYGSLGSSSYFVFVGGFQSIIISDYVQFVDFGGFQNYDVVCVIVIFGFFVLFWYFFIFINDFIYVNFDNYDFFFFYLVVVNL